MLLLYLYESHASDASIAHHARFESLSKIDKSLSPYTFELRHSERAFHIDQALEIMLEVFEDEIEATSHLVFTTRYTMRLLENSLSYV